MTTETYSEVKSYTWKDPSGLLRWLFVFFAIAIALYVSIAAISAYVWTIWAGFTFIEEDAALVLDQVFAALTQCVGPIFFVCAFLVMRLTYRLVANCHSRDPDTTLAKPAFAAFAYVIPFASLILPPLIMGELWRASFKGAARRRNPNGVIGLWWGAFLAGGVSGLAAIAASGAFTQTPTATSDPNVVMSMLRLDAITFSTRGLSAILLLYIFGVLVKQQKVPQEDTAGVFD